MGVITKASINVWHAILPAMYAWEKAVAELPILPDPAGDSQKINPSGHMNLTTSLIREAFCPICYMYRIRSNSRSSRGAHSHT